MCELCPVGATCRGGLAPPVSDPGAPLEIFWADSGNGWKYLMQFFGMI